ncbi:hypothetical protein OGM84_04240 [Pediococcus acidilactici]
MTKKFDVIVNVPALQTNTPFTYRADAAIENDIKIGSRVIVPFGQAGRPVQGFVIGENRQGSPMELKNIISLLEPEPFLNQELIDLSAWLADKTFSFRVTCLNAMLPNLVKINTKRFVKVNRQRIDPQRVVEVLGEQQVVDLKVNELDYPQQRQLNQWVKDGSVTLEYATENSARKKMINWIWPLVDAEQITQITKTVRPNARQQLKLLQLIPEISVKEGLSQASLIKDYQISRGTVDHAVEQGWLKRDLVEQYRDPFAQSDLQTDQELNLNDEQFHIIKYKWELMWDLVWDFKISQIFCLILIK